MTRRPFPIATLLAICLAVAATGCTVLPIAFDRSTIPSARATLVGLEDVQHQLDSARTTRDKNVEAAQDSRPVSAHGSASGAYERWADDEVKELPEVETSVIQQ